MSAINNLTNAHKKRHQGILITKIIPKHQQITGLIYTIFSKT